MFFVLIERVVYIIKQSTVAKKREIAGRAKNKE